MITSENKNNSVLIVDDDEIILIALIETMQSEGYHIVKANTPLDAIEKLKKEKFAVIISDQRMA
jgi:DNA-binding NtrC family response regulator